MSRVRKSLMHALPCPRQLHRWLIVVVFFFFLASNAEPCAPETKKIKNVCRQNASCSGNTLLRLLVASWSSLSWCHLSLAANTFWIFYPVTGLLPCDYNFHHHVLPGASTTSTTFGHPPLQHLLLDCFILIFHPCKVGGSTTMEVAVQCHMTKCWKNCMRREVNGPIAFPCHAYLPGRWWHDTKHSPLDDTKQHMQHLCSTWLIVSSSHFQKLPDKNYFFVWQKIQVLFLESLKMRWKRWMRWMGWFGEKIFSRKRKKSFRSESTELLN